jgi:hypothetical protein
MVEHRRGVGIFCQENDRSCASAAQPLRNHGRNHCRNHDVFIWGSIELCMTVSDWGTRSDLPQWGTVRLRCVPVCGLT